MTLLMREVVAITAAVDQGVAHMGVAPHCAGQLIFDDGR